MKKYTKTEINVDSENAEEGLIKGKYDKDAAEREIYLNRG